MEIERPPAFGAGELELLAAVQPICEELVGDHFRLSSFGPTQRCYEVVTLVGCSEAEREPMALAKLCRYDRRERVIGGSHRISRFYRVCLQDDNLLARVERGLCLRALLLYVLTHELIHVVRFESFQVIYDAPAAARQREEARVDELARLVLEPLLDSTLREVIAGLAPGRLDVLFAQE